MMEIPIETDPCNFLKDGKPCFRGRVRYNGVVHDEELLDETAVACGGANPAFIRCVWKVFFDKCAQAIGAGKRIDCEDFSGGMGVHGTFKTADAPWDPELNALVPYLTPKGRIKVAAEGLVGVNVTKGPSVSVRSVMQDIDGAVEDVIVALPGDIVLLIAGTGLRVDTEAEDEGVFLVDAKTGETVATGQVTGATATTLDCMFGELPPAGQYLLAVSSRNGMGDAYGVATGKRKVTVKAVEE